MIPAQLFLSLLLAGIPPASIEITATPEGAAPITAHVDLPATEDGYRHRFVELVDGAERTLLQIHVDSHEGWHEVALTNGSIEATPGFWTGDYSVRLVEDGGADWSVDRHGALFYDGTGYLELLGRPVFDPQPNAAFWYYRHLVELLQNDPEPYLAAVRDSNPPEGLEGYPHTEWDAANWHTTRFDRAFSTHQTGSPSVKGSVASRGARFAALWSYGTDADTALADDYANALWGKVGQQCRRQLHFYHGSTGNVWRADSWPKLVMGEWGPVKLWGSTELWGRPSQAVHGDWNGWDLEHLEVDTQAMAWVLFGSRFALREMRHKLEGVMTHPHMKDPWKESTPRIVGWSLKALVLGAALDPDPDRALRYRQAAEFILASWSNHFRKSPRYSMQSDLVKADGRHLFPDITEVQAYFQFKEWPWPVDNPLYLAALAEVDKKAAALKALPFGAKKKDIEWAEYELTRAKHYVVHAVANHVYEEYGASAQFDMLRVWGWMACFHAGTVAAGLRAYADLVGDPEVVRAQANDLLAYFMLEARNAGVDGGTFHYDTAVWLNGRNVGTGKDTEGVVHWVAGGLGMLGPWVPGAWRPTWRQAVDSVYRRSPAARPGAGVETCTFESWFVPYAAEAGYP